MTEAGSPYGADLLAHHAELLHASSITPDVAAARGYNSVHSAVALGRLGFAASQRLTPALLIPVRNVTGDISTYQIRPDKPRVVDGKALKYETPLKSRLTLDVPPG